MILRELHVDGFGCLGKQRFKFGDGLTLISGPNESGKSTLVECIVRLLFGYPEHQYNKALEDRRPWKGRAFSAALVYTLDDGRELETRRDFSRPDVPTHTVERAVMRPIADLSGTRKASPGQSLLNLSMEAYEAAAVMRATEFSQRPDAKDSKAYELLAERIAALVGSAGEAGAAAALERLDAFARDQGSDRASTKPLSLARTQAASARSALDGYRRDAEHMRQNLTTRATLNAENELLNKTERELNARVAGARLRSLQRQISDAEKADKELVQAQQDRARIGVTPEMLQRADRVDRAIDAWRNAKAAENAAMSSSQSKEDERKAVLAQLKEWDDKLVEYEATIKRNSTAIDRLQPEAGTARISAQTLEHLEELSELADQQEAVARRKETQVRVARSRPRPGALASLFVIIVALALFGAGAAAHIPGLTYSGLAGVGVGVVLLAVFLLAQRSRTAFERGLEQDARDARAVADQAGANLARECATFQLGDIRAARRAAHVQSETDRFSQARASAEELTEQARRQQTLLEARFNEFSRADETLVNARKQADDCARDLQHLFDDSGVPGGDLEGRIATFREARLEIDRAVNAERQIGGYRAALAGALGTRSLDELREQAAIMTRQGIAPAEGDVDALLAKLNDTSATIRKNELELQRIAGELTTFDARYAEGGAPLEERLAACELEESRIARARDAAVLARDVIEKAKDDVHKDFAPHLNALAGPALAKITHGRYSEVAVDPRDFALRVRAPEHGATVEMWTLSSGTQEQLALTLRAATAQALGSGERVPLLLDDALAHADERRLTAAIAQLASIAHRQQVLLLTQRDGVLAAAAGLEGVTVIRLSGPTANAAAAAT